MYIYFICDLLFFRIMAIKRLFFGVFVENELFDKPLEELQTNLDPYLKGKWTEQKNLHFTLKFLGNVEEERIPDIIKFTSRSLVKMKSPIKLQGIGYFPLKGQPDIFFARLHNQDKSIIKNYKNIETSMVKLGFKKDQRRYFPHISLLRIKSFMPGFREEVLKYKDIQIGIMSSYRINLIESTLTPTGPIYNIIA